MQLALKRSRSGYDGIFSTLSFPQGFFLETIEHAYALFDPSSSTGNQWVAKLPAGTYACKRGSHMLHSGHIETFEVLNVPGHTGILFHRGNSQIDSDGCILVGTTLVSSRLIKSHEAFERFIQALDGLEEFTLVVT